MEARTHENYTSRETEKSHIKISRARFFPSAPRNRTARCSDYIKHRNIYEKLTYIICLLIYLPFVIVPVFIYPKFTELLNIVTSHHLSLEFFQLQNCKTISKLIFETLTQCDVTFEMSIDYVRVSRKIWIGIKYRFAVNLFPISCAFCTLIVSLNKYLIGC